MAEPGLAIYCCSLAGELCSEHNMDSGGSAIRVLDIEPAAAFEDPVVVSTCILQLKSGEKYQTLSYCWGEPVLDEIVTCNRVALAVTSHLEVGLRRVRSLKLPDSGMIWIDAICINQKSDLLEKSTQVQLMATIYKQSSRLLIWLGEAAELETAVLDEMVKTRHIDHAGTSAVQKLLRNAWFSRRWILQEVLLSPAARRHVLYGNIRMKLERLLHLYARYMKIFSWESRRDLPSQWLLEPCREHNAGSWPRNQKSYPFLLENLYAFRHTACDLDIDRIYTLLGLSRDGIGVTGDLIINYTLHRRDLYRSLAIYYLSNGGTLNKARLLAWATCTRSPSNNDWPSRVPDWTVHEQYRSQEHEICCDILRQASYGGTEDWSGVMSMSDTELRITAHLLPGTSPPDWSASSPPGEELPPWPRLLPSEEYMYIEGWDIARVVHPRAKEGTYSLVSCFLVASPLLVKQWGQDLKYTIPQQIVRSAHKRSIILILTRWSLEHDRVEAVAMSGESQHQ